MAERSTNRLLLIFLVAMHIIIILICCSVTFLLHHPPATEEQKKPLDLSPDVDPTVAKIAEALHSQGNYSAMIPELISKFDPAQDDCWPADGRPVTIFVPRDSAAYHVCVTERPGIRVVLSRVDPYSFGRRAGRLAAGSVLRTCDGGEVRVEESKYAVHAEVADWNLYDDGGVTVHGIGGELMSYDSLVATVGKYAVSGLVEKRRIGGGGGDDGLESLCRLPRRLPAPRTHERYVEAFFRRVDGRKIGDENY